VSLLNLAPPTPHLPQETLTSPGGFAWWYADILDEKGNGIVVIWSYGLPFLPGYAAAARAGTPELPRDRPSINVSVYRERRLACYLLQELPPRHVDWRQHGWRLGESEVVWETQDGRGALDVWLDCPLPATRDRLTGRLRLEGAVRTAVPGQTWEGHHDWSPLLCGAAANCDLRTGSQRFRFTGSGYYDCNAGREPLQTTGIDAWAWGRVPGPTQDRIYYVLWPSDGSAPEAHGYETSPSGVLSEQTLDVAVDERRRGLAGLRHPQRLILCTTKGLWLDVAVARVVDDGPFYIRHFLRCRDGRPGIGEFCRPDRIDLAMHRPLVRMRVHRVEGDNSMWLPLFTGPRRGRLRRLFGQWRP